MTDAEVEPRDGTLLARLGLTALAVGTLYSGLAAYVHQVGGPKPLLVILAIVVVSAGVAATAPYRPLVTLRAPIVLWAYAYLLLTTASAIYRTRLSAVTDQAVVDRFRCMAFLLAMLLVFDDGRVRRFAGIAVVAVALASSLVNVAEAFGAFRFVDYANRTEGRAAGLYVNPNQSGQAIALGLAAGISFVPRPLRVPTLLLGACGIAATFSRSSFLMLGVLVVVLVLRRDAGGWTAALAAAAIGLLVAFTGGHLDRTLERLLDVPLNQDVLARISMSADDSGRGALAAKVWRMFLEAPWFGNGIATEGNTGRISHNLYLSLAAEHGVLGLLAFPALALAVVVRNRSALGFGLVLLAAGVFSHNLLEFEPALVCLALAAAARPRPDQAGEPEPDATLRYRSA